MVKFSCWPAAHLALPTVHVEVPIRPQRRRVWQIPQLPKSHVPSSLHQSLHAHQRWLRRGLYRYLTLFVAVFRQEGSAWKDANRTPSEALTGPQ